MAIAVVLSAIAGCRSHGGGGGDPLEDGEPDLTRVVAVDFEGDALGRLRSPWSLSPGSGASTASIVRSVDHGKVLLLHGSNSSFLTASLGFSSSANEIVTEVDIEPDHGAAFIFTLTGAGTSIGRRRIRLQRPPGTDTLELQTVPAGTVSCGPLPSGVWSSVTLVVHAQSLPHTADVLIDGSPTACTGISVGLSPPFSGVQIMDASNEGWAGNVRFDDIVVSTP